MWTQRKAVPPSKILLEEEPKSNRNWLGGEYEGMCKRFTVWSLYMKITGSCIFTTVKTESSYLCKIYHFYLACSAGVFSRFGRANGFACESAMLRFLSPIFLCHKIKDGGYNNTNMNKLSPTQNTPALQANFYPTILTICNIGITHSKAATQRRWLSSSSLSKPLPFTSNVIKKIKEVNKTEPREIIQVWNKKKFAGFYNEVNPVLAALDSFQFYFFFPLKDTSKSRCKLRMAPF